MSQQTNAANATNTSASATVAASATEPSSISKAASSLMGSLKKQKKKDEAANEQTSPLTDEANGKFFRLAKYVWRAHSIFDYSFRENVFFFYFFFVLLFLLLLLLLPPIV